MKQKIPFTLNHYYFSEILGKGSFGNVYKAKSLLYNTEFAAKLIPLPKNSYFQVSQSFSAEVMALQKLDHQNIIRLYDFFSIDDFFCIILEYCPGGTLKSLINPNIGVDSNFLYDSCYQIIDAVSACHLMGISHRDIKASNVLIDSHGRLKLADFGLCRVIKDKATLSVFDGSLAYSAPEILLKKEHDPFLSDIWSLGVLFFQMATGKLPWNLDSEESITLSIVRCVLPPEIENGEPIMVLIKRMIVFNPHDRISILELKNHPLFLKKITLIPKKFIYRSRYSNFLTKPISQKRRVLSKSLSHNDV